MDSVGSDLLGFLQELAMNALRRPLRCEVLTVGWTVMLLNVLLSCKGKWHLEDENVELLRIHMSTVIQIANVELRRVMADVKWLCPDLEHLERGMLPRKWLMLSGIVERLQLLKPDIQQLCTILSNSSRSISSFHHESAKRMLGFLSTVVIEDMLTHKFQLIPAEKELRAVQNALQLLSNFIGFTAERCRRRNGKMKDLLIHAESVVDEVSCLLYPCAVNEEMNDEMLKEIKLQLSSVLPKIIPGQAKVGKIYIEALKISKSEGGIFKLDYLDSFLQYFVLHLSGKLSLAPSNRVQIKFLYNEVQFLRRFLDESSVQDQMYNCFQERIIAVIIDTICAIIYCHYNHEQNIDEARDFRMSVYDLQQFFMHKKENAPEADCIYLQKPWRFLRPNPWREIFSQLEFLWQHHLDKIVSPLADQLYLIKEELKPLKGVFSAIQPNLHEDFEIQKRRLVRVLDHTNLVITSFKYRMVTLWSCKLELYNVIQKIRMIKMEMGDSINRFTDDARIFEAQQLSNGAKNLLILSIVGMLELEGQLRCIETNMNLTSPLKDDVHILRLKASFLRVFLNCKGKWYIEDENLKVILTGIKNVFRNANLRKLWADFILTESTGYWALTMNIQHMLYSMRERLDLLNPDIQNVYTILSKSSRYITGMIDEAITESLNSLLENIEELLKFNVEMVSPIKEELEAVKKCVRFFIDLICFTAKRCNKLGTLKDLLVFAEILVDTFSSLLYLCFVSDEMNHEMMKEVKVRLSIELKGFSPAEPNAREIYIKSLKASMSTQGSSKLVDDQLWCFLDSLQDYIVVLLNTQMWSTTSMRDQILLLHEDLPFLVTYFAMDLSLEEHIGNDHRIFMDILERTSATLNEIGYVLGSTLNIQNGQQKDIYKKLSDFLYFHSSRSNFPKTNGEGFIGALLGNLKKLLNSKDDSVAPLKYQIEKVQVELLFVRDDFNKMAKQPNQCRELHTQWTRFIDCAYHVEYFIDSFLAGSGTFSFYEFRLHKVLDEINTIKIELEAIKNKIPGDRLVNSIYFLDQLSTEAELISKRPVQEKYTTELVIFPEAKEEIIEHLTSGFRNLNFLLIVGMPGIGKTTLANSVFQHSSITNHFHVHARCCISQVYDKRRLLRDILEELTGENGECEDEHDLEVKLYRRLKGRRYLIYMDDIWSLSPWEEIRNCFPNDEMGSRIMFTSRFDCIASQVGPDGINYRLLPLSPDRSWEMLEWKIFGDKGCSTDDLAKIGYEIAENCKGVPLTIDLIAGILRGKETIVREWKKVAHTMKEYLHDPQGRCQKVLELSYQNLPEELRPCFLYYATFPEDANIRTRDLILLWIAEGFVQLQKDDQICLEDAAKEILSNLINRSLVMVSKRGFLERVKATQIHDLLHNFALIKAKEERFMLKMDGSPLSRDGNQLRGQYRMSIISDNWDKFRGSNISGTCTRSLIYFEDGSHISWQLSYFKLLRVLCIPCIVYECDPAIFTLIHLRFLAISIYRSNILVEIHKLGNLETLILYNDWSSDLCLFPYEVCSMTRLRNFFFRNYVSLRFCREKIVEKCIQFHTLRTVYRVKVSYADDIENIFKLMPNLVKLKVAFYNPDGGCYPFPKLDFLEKLELLKVKHDCTAYPCKIINFPPNVKTLVLTKFCLPWTEISELGKFENVEILKLKWESFKGATWDMDDGQFPKLKYLSLNNLDIEEWNATGDDFPCLEQLHVRSCKKLKELPDCLAEVPALQKIRLYRCRNSVKSSAQIIKEATANYQLTVKAKEIYGDDEE